MGKAYDVSGDVINQFVPPPSTRRSTPTDISGYQAVKRIFHILIALGLSALTVYTVLDYQQRQQQWIAAQQQTPGTVLAGQYARLFSPLVQAQQYEELNQALVILTAEPRVIQAGVFNSQGVQIAPAEPLPSLLDQAPGAVTHIHDIANNAGVTIGYIRLLTYPQQTVRAIEQLQQGHWLVGVTLILLAFTAGLYLARLFYKVRPALKRHYRRWGQGAAFPSAQNRRR